VSATCTTMDAGGDITTGLTGTVRSYNGAKGFGFITGQGAFADVMFSRMELPEDTREVRGKFIENRLVSFDAMIKPDGRAKATSVMLMPQQGLGNPGTIKSYSDKHGYGFVSSHSLPGSDAHFKKGDFSNPVSGGNLQGELVIFEADTLPDGKMRVTKIQFQSAKIAEKVNGGASMGMGMGMGMPNMMGANQVMQQMNQMNPGMPMAQQMAMMQALQMQQMGMGMQGMKRGASDMMGGAFKVAKTADVAVTTTGQIMNGSVKSYNPQKGWGLIASPGIPSGGSGASGDVFFMKSNLPMEVRDTNVTGQSVTFELVQTNDGKYRAQNVAMA
ncbi:unnamed protein product, partial [Polarella glacialis]